MKRGRDEVRSTRENDDSRLRRPSALPARHQLTLRARESLHVEGVLNVESFDDEHIFVETDQGVMHVKGEQLHIKELNLAAGSLHVSGFVRSLEYSGDKAGARKRAKGIFNRLFR